MDNTCYNCDSHLDKDYIIENFVKELLSTNTREKALQYLNEEFDFSFNQACDTCYHTWWLDEDEKKELFEIFDNYKN